MEPKKDVFKIGDVVQLKSGGPLTDFVFAGTGRQRGAERLLD